jgi:hypothetical protein
MPSPKRMDVLVLYDDRSLKTSYVTQHLESIQRFSRHRVHYAAATVDRKADFPLELYDAIIIHFSVRLSQLSHITSDFAFKVTRFSGTKVLLIQDEYDAPATACGWIRRLGIQAVFSTVPAEQRSNFYPAESVPNVQFHDCLTGYVPFRLPDDLLDLPIAKRPTSIVYRGRHLPLWYGKLGREKHEIGVRMREICKARHIPHDIEWTENKRIYGDDWFRFLASGRVCLGTESGANVADVDGKIRESVEQAQTDQPGLGDDEIYRALVAPYDGQVRMNQISPKIFEAIATRTGLVLFQGTYSGIIRPDEHFIPLAKDFSNIDDVVQKVADPDYLQAMVDRAHADIVQSGRFSYNKFVSCIDTVIEDHGKPRAHRRWHYIAVRADDGPDIWSSAVSNLPQLQPTPYFEQPADELTLKVGVLVGNVVSLQQQSTSLAGSVASLQQQIASLAGSMVSVQATLNQAYPQAQPPVPLLSGWARGAWLALPRSVRQPLIVLLGPLVRQLSRLRDGVRTE